MRDIWLGAKLPGVGLLAICPGNQGCGKIRARDVGVRIAAAKARIDIDHATAVLADEHVAIHNPDMAQLLADQLANHLESIIPHRYGPIGLPSPHPDFTPDKSADIAAVEIIDYIHPMLFP